MTDTKTISNSRLWTARVMRGVVILFMLMDSIMKFVQPAAVIEGTVSLGFAEHHILLIGILGLLSTLLYTFPKTSILGAILLTGYWGGAIATHVRLDNPLFSHVLFPIYLAILAWGGIWLVNDQLQNLLPLKKSNNH